MKDLIIITITTLITLGMILYVENNDIRTINGVPKETLDLAVPYNGTIDVDYLNNN